jgi:cytochrome c553
MRVAIGMFLVATAGLASARHSEPDFTPPAAFQLAASLGDATPGRPTPASLTSTRIAAAGDGGLVVDADSGALTLFDRAGRGLAQLAIGHDAGLLVYDDAAHVAYVADRRGDRVVAVAVGTSLAVVRTWKTPAEPYGIALMPDRKTALVTCVADRVVVAYDVATGAERWRKPIGDEPRGIAISPDGVRALIGSLSTGAVDELGLGDSAHVVTRRSLPTAGGSERARGAFAVTFLGDHLAVAPYQREMPVAEMRGEEVSTGHYGGGSIFFPPINHSVAFLGFGGRSRTVVAETSVKLPRAVAWDQSRDALYLAGLGTDEIVGVVKASQIDAKAGKVANLNSKERCGIDGLAIAADGNLFVWCSFTRSVAKLRVLDDEGKPTRWKPSFGPELSASTLDPSQHLGMTLFHSSNGSISSFGALACANCHLEGRADGLSWRIGTTTLQTPMLAGRVAGTAPYKWNGGAKDLQTSLRETLGRLGGSGLGKPQFVALAAYLESMPAVRAPTLDRAAVTRGAQIFDEAGCNNCHDGARYTDRARHRLARGQSTIDTPSLLGVSASAPYFHDGSAATLEVLLRDGATVHGMSEPAMALTDGQIKDLTAFLRSI